METPAPKRSNSSPQHETAEPVVESSGSNIVDRGCKVATGSLMTYLGYGALTLGFAALSVATGGLATIIALGVIGAGATTMLFGANEVIEGVTDYNPLRAGANNLGMSDEDYYLALSFASSASMAGTYYYSSGAGKSVNNSSAKGVGKSVSKDIKVIGRLPDTSVAKDWPGHDVLNTSKWDIGINDDWVNAGVKNKQDFYVASPMTKENLISSNPRYPGETVFAREIRMLQEAGYVQKGDYFIHPNNLK